MAVLEEAFLIRWLHSELQMLFPRECAGRGPAGLEDLVSNGVHRARLLELTRDDLLPYLAMEMCFGEAFLEDPTNEWARQALAEPGAGRMQRLRRAGIFRLAKRVERDRRQQAAWAEAEAQRQAERNSDQSGLEEPANA
jgi:hypothetical protein